MRVKYVHTLTDKNGNKYFYFRRRGSPRLALPGPMGSPEFMEAYKYAFYGRNDGEHPFPAAIIKRVARAKGLPRRKQRVGVYLLILGEEVVYIGASQNMRQRVSDHRQNGRPFDKAFYIETHPKQRHGLEDLLIKAIRPKQNKNGLSKTTSGSVK